MRTSNLKMIQIALIATVSGIALGFQNCAGTKVGFSDASPTAASQSIPPVICGANLSSVNGVCTPTIFTECMQFVELDTTQNPINIPTLASSGTCYYKKILGAIPLHASGSDGEARATDVLSRDHDTGSATPSNPFIIGDSSLNFVFNDNRTVSLSSTASADLSQGNLFIDNYFLVEQTASGQPDMMLARGTADAPPFTSADKSTVGSILVNGNPVTDFISYAAGGTAQVGYIDISKGFVLNLETTLRVRLLDCGGSATASDVYIIIH